MKNGPLAEKRKEHLPLYLEEEGGGGSSTRKKGGRTTHCEGGERYKGKLLFLKFSTERKKKG